MSLCEIFDHGVPIPWANLRCNNLTVDGELINGPTGGVQTFDGKLLNVSDTLSHNVFTYNLPSSPLNGAFRFVFTVVAKGGPPGNLANAMMQSMTALVQITNNIITSLLNLDNMPHFIGFGAGAVGGLISNVGGTVIFSVTNTVAGQSTSYLWQVVIYPLIGTF